ncbi:hypothetical protein CKM354_000308200 [Cercospora kikuchii]|uniref:Uncharacterized protein n=1 Tax=Cercospora kikuchii TaxID=84275 RepID=A0A9P3CB50_9PEZI|nr:uncharacterized protein CKM354_000308200 [Cercospora kikuchii]GIZ39709.1 hypothetical protein CKM354_000308200 [Cercospora kikuchii]
MAGLNVHAAMNGTRMNDSTTELFRKSNTAHRLSTQRSSAMEDKSSPTLLHPREHYASSQSQTDSPGPVNRSSLLARYNTGTTSFHRARVPPAYTTTEKSELKSGISTRILNGMAPKRPNVLSGAVEHETEGQAASKRQKLFDSHHRVRPSANVLLDRRRTARNSTPDPSDQEDTASHSASSVEDAEPLFVSPSLTPLRERSSTISTDRNNAPNTRTMDYQRKLDRNVVKYFIKTRITPSDKNSAWNREDRLSFIMSSYDDKLKEREKAGGSWRSLWPDYYRARGKNEDMDWLRNTFSGYLAGSPSPTSASQNGRAGFHDDDDEEVVVKREEVEVHEARQNDLELQSSMPSSNGKTRRRWKTMHRQNRSRSGSNEGYEVHASSFKTRGSTSVPEFAGPEWRQYWQIRNDGSAVLVTPRTWKWNSSRELVAWPPLDQILPPLKPIPQPQNTE